MTYDLQFLPSALKEWQKLGSTVREQFKKKLAERLETPRVSGDALHGLEHHYKIKLRSSGYRLVYRVEDQSVTVTVVAVGKRERSEVYKLQRRGQASNRSMFMSCGDRPIVVCQAASRYPPFGRKAVKTAAFANPEHGE